MSEITLRDAAKRLLEADDVLLLLHDFPDGDTIGSGVAVGLALRAMGKRARIMCPREIGEKYDYLTATLPDDDFAPRYIVAVDVADDKLLGGLRESYAGKIDLVIDHHPSNRRFGKENLVLGEAAAACEIVKHLLDEMSAPITPEIASALYTGIATDTGCFRYTNTTSDSHRIAADLTDAGAKVAHVNRVMFDTVSPNRIAVEQAVLRDLQYLDDGRIAIMTLPLSLTESVGAADDELEGITALPRKIEGVLLGITLREKAPGVYKISMRSHVPVDASVLCGKFGGGGHVCAAGCELRGSVEEVRETLGKAAVAFLRESGVVGA